jgi:ribosomal protein L37E
MEGHGEAAADIITGGVIARAIEPDAGAADSHGAHDKCRNCGTALAGAYCSACGQPAHLHRSLSSLGHEILHGVFHFEGKIWRTIPELLFHPGRLTRRYIDGERAKFVSPMALYLFTVFLMFAVFSFTSSSHWVSLPKNADGVSPAAQWKSNINDQMEAIDEKMETIQERLNEEELSEAQRAKLQSELADQKAARYVMDAMVKGEWGKIAELEKEQDARRQAEAAAAQTAPKKNSGSNFKTQWPALDARLNNLVQDLNESPGLFAYKLKSAGYKYSWALIPLSVPFMWLLFFWRRDIHLYDHAVFVTYSICFMMLFAILLSIATTAGLSAAIWGTALAFVPPLHLYKQLRGAYGLSRFGAVMRLFMLSILVSIVLTLFSLLLLMLGLLG